MYRATIRPLFPRHVLFFLIQKFPFGLFKFAQMFSFFFDCWLFLKALDILMKYIPTFLNNRIIITLSLTVNKYERTSSPTN